MPVNWIALAVGEAKLLSLKRFNSMEEPSLGMSKGPSPRP
jgi:hypothetical protein